MVRSHRGPPAFTLRESSSRQLAFPFGVTLDVAGNLFFTDIENQRVRRVDAGTGIITTVAGTGAFGYNGDGIPATSAQLARPIGVALDVAGNLFITDIENQRIRRVDAGTGIITTVAGTGTFGYNGDGILATSAQLARPVGITLDAVGNLFIADINNQRIRRVDARTGIITTVAGTGTLGYNGDGIPATSAQLDHPIGLSVDLAGNLFIADTDNSRVRRVQALEREIAIDIKPGSFPNSINLGSNGVVPVAILSTDTFDASTVDPFTVTLAGAAVRMKGKSGNAGSLFESSRPCSPA